MVQGHGVNDMPKNWRIENENNHKIYETWRSMLCRCYSEKYHKRCPTYIGCSVCSKWLKLSGFVEDVKLIDGYNEEKFIKGEICLDKDIKSNGVNKEYSLENCLWTSMAENIRQAVKTRDNNYLQKQTGENNPMYGKTGENHPMYGNGKTIAQYDKQGNLIKIWNCISDVQRELGIDHGHIVACCKFWEINCNKEEWFKTHKAYPHKSCGGFVFKYYKEDDKN